MAIIKTVYKHNYNPEDDYNSSAWQKKRPYLKPLTALHLKLPAFMGHTRKNGDDEAVTIFGLEKESSVVINEVYKQDHHGKNRLLYVNLEANIYIPYNHYYEDELMGIFQSVYEHGAVGWFLLGSTKATIDIKLMNAYIEGWIFLNENTNFTLETETVELRDRLKVNIKSREKNIINFYKTGDTGLFTEGNLYVRP